MCDFDKKITDKMLSVISHYFIIYFTGVKTTVLAFPDVIMVTSIPVVKLIDVALS
ncbi:hypothetical protein llh_4870 [Lactococcus cremoris subsp. cremoris A76]|nr:hypothetical protein llh_4870 [Lactococcus cremoris subsp. cremoris A76]